MTSYYGKKKRTLDYNKLKNIFNYDEKFKLKTLIKFVIIALIPCIFFSGFFIWQVRKIIDSENTIFMEYFKNEQIRKIKGFYENLGVKLGNYANDLTPYLTGGSQNNININKNDKSNYIENIYIFDGSFNTVKVLQQNIQVSQDEAGISLKNIKFTMPSYVGSFFIKDNKAYQYYYYKILINGSLKGYVVFILNTNFFSNYLDNTTNNVNTEVLDGNFNILHSYEISKLFKTDINPLTKKMLDGNVGTEIWNGNKNFYGYINLNDSSLYLNVYEKQEDIYLKATSLQRYLVFITTIVIIEAFVLGWRYIGKLKLYLNNYSSSKEYFRKMKVFDNLQNYIDEIDDITEELLESNNKINKLKGQINSIRDKLGNEESEVNADI